MISPRWLVHSQSMRTHFFVSAVLSAIVASAISLANAASVAPEAGGSYQAWSQHRRAMVKDASLVHYYTFEDVGL